MRQGNNEEGDWEEKSWRHLDLDAVLKSMLIVMKKLVESRNTTMVSIYVASDSEQARQWFDTNIPKYWEAIQPEKVMSKPKISVWFGDRRSARGDVLNKTMKNKAMAEATAEMMARGECDALLVPNYIFFSYPGIALLVARKKPAFSRVESGAEFREISTFTDISLEPRKDC